MSLAEILASNGRKSPDSSGFCGIIETAPKSACNTRQGLTRSTGLIREGLPTMVPTTCTFNDCDEPYSARGYCVSHYGKLGRLGQLPPKPTAVDRFWPKVDKSGVCWEWTAYLSPKGYGHFRADGKTWHAHRYSYVLHNGSISDDLFVDHRCHNRACVNPAHLRAVTPKQNEENRLGANKTSVSGVRGVHWDKQAGKWVAQLMHNRKPHFAGYFDTIPEAEASVIAKRNELFTHNDLDRIKAEANA